MNTEPIHVLLVDDDEQEYHATRELLAAADANAFRVAWCQQLADTLVRLPAGNVDVILLDNTLPDSKGWQTLDTINEQASGLPVIYLADGANEAQGVEAIKRGAQDYLTKGAISQEQLVRAIRYAIERKKAEVQLHRYRQRLQDMVDDATRDLLTANEKLRKEIAERALVEGKLREAVARLEAHNESKDQFVSNVSHELRTPLASIAHALENMSKGVLGPMDQHMQDYVAMMQEDCRRLLGTITDILDMNRIEANRLVLNRRKLHLGRFAEHAVAALRLQAERKHHQLEVHANGSPSFVECDPSKMERVIHNLVGNAVKFTPDGGHVVVNVRREGKANPVVVLEVVDNGGGIEPHNLPRVTERYFRVGEHVTGSGLGLSLCKDVVELHGGTLRMASPPPGTEHGTLAAIELPAAPPPRVLVVDDDEAVRDLLSRQLVQFGYIAATASSGPEALTLLATSDRPDFMIVDVMLPAMDGFELIARLKSEPRLRQVPILVITGYELDEDRRNLLAGFDVALLRKPWTRRDLIQSLEELTIGPARTGI